MEVDHLGIATDDADALAERLSALLDAPVVHTETFDGLELVFIDVGGTELELIEPLDDANTVARFIDRRGPGLHHVAVATPDVAGAIAAAEAMGIELIDETPRPGARGHRVAFLHPGSTGGVLVEFVERRAAG